MAKKDIVVNLSAEKLEAMEFYASEKETSVQEELDKFIESLYGKLVPTQHRRFIERNQPDSPARPTGRQKKKENEPDKPEPQPQHGPPPNNHIQPQGTVPKPDSQGGNH